MSKKILGVLRGAFQGFGCPKRHPDALLAKTMAQRTVITGYRWAGNVVTRLDFTIQ